MRVVAFAALLCGCLRADLVECGAGIACAAHSACATFVVEQRLACIPDAAFAACTGAMALDECTLDGVALARCYATDVGLACLPSSCGNQLIDPDEVCDDGNALVGDGCSAGCRSDETCGNGVIDGFLGEGRRGEECDDGNLRGHDGCASDCTAEQPLVQAIESPVANSLRSGHRLAYDSVRERVVMFGGGSNKTLELGPGGWEIMPTTLDPPNRARHVLVYDPVHRQTILFGGATTSLFGDTWAWDGSSWKILTPSTTARPRSSTSAVFDPVSKQLLLYGGVGPGNVELDEMWTWTGEQWLPVISSGASPGPRTLAGMALDPARGQVVLVAGTYGLSDKQQTWIWNGQAWTSAAPAPDGLLGAGLAFDGIGVIGVGGDTTWRWNGTSWSAVGGAPNVGLDNQAIVYEAARDRVIAVANSGMTYAWNRTSWSELSSSTLSVTARTTFATAFDANRNRWVIHGGEVGMPGADNRTWELVGLRWVFRASSGPSIEDRSPMVYDLRRKESVLFTDGKTWIWNGSTWTQRMSSRSPSVRTRTAMAYDAKRGVAVLFGGAEHDGWKNDTWEWDGQDWTDVSPSLRPAARIDHTMAWDPQRERVVVAFGGSTDTPFQDQWEWDGAAWTRRTIAAFPTARARSALVWNPARARLALYGGAPDLGDLWELDDRWEQRFLMSDPTGRFDHSMAPATDGSGVLIFAGRAADGRAAASPFVRVAWLNTTTTYEVCTDATIDADGDGLAGCADEDCWWRCSPECPPDVSCPAGSPTCGDGTCSAVESCRLCPSDCGACAPICGDFVCSAGETCPGDC